MNLVGIRYFQLEEWDWVKRWKKVLEEPKIEENIVELRNRAMNIIILLYVKIESKSSTFGVKEISGEEREFFLSVSYSRVVELWPNTYLVFVVIEFHKEE